MQIHQYTELFYLILPVIIGGVLNMVWVKLPILDTMKTPMDKGKLWTDGRQIFGDNKTWKGFWGMVVLTALAAVFVLFMLSAMNASYRPYIGFSGVGGVLLFGALLGLAYVLGELPNSFIKRRINISPGTNGHGWVGRLFVVVDQIDSVIACCVVIAFYYPMTLVMALLIVVFCGVLHIVINMMLRMVGLRKQWF